ncbi:hypothetical protein HMPREF2785_07675 [Corynebacterium sp. HMSC067D03]|nr:hypothetical protein HMPREF2785_07675 [Corynebacterium sp. HMSC067D03]
MRVVGGVPLVKALRIKLVLRDLVDLVPFGSGRGGDAPLSEGAFEAYDGIFNCIRCGLGFTRILWG